MKCLTAAASLAVMLGTVLSATALPVFAADYPDRPIKMIVAYPPGGATDVMARAVSQRLGDRIKQPVVI